jgi:glycosyltransferase involved in cell wall biosynthesis
MKKIKLSYVLTTFNKYSFIKVVLPELVQNKKNDEEIIVIDGGSNDGTNEYLGGQHNTGNIDYFLTEKDKGEAHGFNKGFLLASGDLIKVITDDDAFNYSVIQKCKDFMLLHPEIDVLGGNTGTISIENKNSLFLAHDFEDDFFKWREGKLKNFFFNGTCLIIRRSSLSLTGLFNTTTMHVDMEYTLRISSVAKIAWCTGIISTRILNSQSNYMRYPERAKIDDEKLCQFYNYKHSHIRKREELKNRSTYKKIHSFLSSVKASFVNKGHSKDGLSYPDNKVYTFDEVNDYCIQWMTNHKLNKDIKFLT